MAININIPIEDAVTDGSLNPVTSNAVFDALADKANTADLATVATTGDYNDLYNLPTIPAAQVNADWNATSGVAEILNKPTIPSTSGFVPYTGATNDVNLGVHDLTATQGTFATSGNPDTLTVNHSSGSGKALTITKGGNGEAVYVNKTSGSGNAVTVVGDLESTNLKRTGGTSAQFLKANGSVDSTSYQPTLVSGTNIKTINGNSLLGSGDLVISGGGGSGIFGITNASGVYTYYATLTLAMAAATSGQTIEMFANVTETGSVTITLKNGVNINGNGYTYTLNNSGLIHAFSAANSVVTSCNINNLNVIRTGSTGSLFDNSCLILGVSGSGVINCSGSTFRNLGSGCGILFNSSSTHEINYAVAYATTTWGAIGIFSSGGARLNNSIGYATSGGYGIRCHSGGDIQNCTGVSDSGYGVYGLNGNQSNSVGISTSGSGFLAAANAYNCVGRSISSIGFEATNAINTVGCVGVSVSGIGLSSSTAFIYNCTGISSSSRGVQLLSGTKAYNLISKSSSSYSILSNSPTVEIHNSTIISEWNNAGGIGISSNNTTIPATILNTTFILSNASAPYLFNNTSAQAVSTRGNTYKGGAAYSVLITQAIVAVEDAQGNIFL